MRIIIPLDGRLLSLLLIGWSIRLMTVSRLIKASTLVVVSAWYDRWTYLAYMFMFTDGKVARFTPQDANSLSDGSRISVGDDGMVTLSSDGSGGFTFELGGNTYVITSSDIADAKAAHEEYLSDEDEY
jgi:hypothetical protein